MTLDMISSGHRDVAQYCAVKLGYKRLTDGEIAQFCAAKLGDYKRPVTPPAQVHPVAPRWSPITPTWSPLSD